LPSQYLSVFDLELNLAVLCLSSVYGLGGLCFGVHLAENMAPLPEV